jgi:predicted RNA-binding protein with TRAM domain
MSRRLPEKAKNAPRKSRRFGSRGRFRPSRPFIQSFPVKENEELEAAIDDIGSRGDGIAKLQGFLIFVPRSKIGERVRVRILSVGGKFAVAERVAQMEGQN